MFLGENNQGQLGREFPNNSKFKPARIEFHSKVKITNISCDTRALLLSSLGEVFIIARTTNKRKVSGPIRFGEPLLGIKQIYTYHEYYFCMKNDSILSWGDNKYYNLGHKKKSIESPEKIDIVDIVINVKCRIGETYLLCQDKTVLYCGKLEYDKFQTTPSKIIIENKQITRIERICDVIIAQDNFRNLYELSLGNSKTKTFSDFDMYSIIKYRETYITYQVNKVKLNSPTKFDEYAKFLRNFNSKILKFHIKKDKMKDNYSGLIISDQKLYYHGYNQFKQTNTNKKEPSQWFYPYSTKIERIYEGNCCIFVKNFDGEIYGWGSNNWGQLGTGDLGKDKPVSQPQKIEFKHEKDNFSIMDIKCGSFHNIALTRYGKVFGWGDNRCGQIKANSSDKCFMKPILMEINDTVKTIYCYKNTSFMITEEHDVFYHGEDLWDLVDYGAIDPNNPEPIKLPFKAKIIVCDDNNIYYLNINYSMYRDNYTLYKINQDNNGAALKIYQTISMNFKEIYEFPKEIKFNNIDYENSKISFGVENIKLCKIIEKVFDKNICHNKYEKLAKILYHIKCLEQNTNVCWIDNTCINLPAIKQLFIENLSPCNFLWDEAYEIIRNEDYNDLCLSRFCDFPIMLLNPEQRSTHENVPGTSENLIRDLEFYQNLPKFTKILPSSSKNKDMSIFEESTPYIKKRRFSPRLYKKYKKDKRKLSQDVQDISEESMTLLGI